MFGMLWVLAWWSKGIYGMGRKRAQQPVGWISGLVTAMPRDTKQGWRKNPTFRVLSGAVENIHQNSLRVREFPWWASGEGWAAVNSCWVAEDFPAMLSIAYVATASSLLGIWRVHSYSYLLPNPLKLLPFLRQSFSPVSHSNQAEVHFLRFGSTYR